MKILLICCALYGSISINDVPQTIDINCNQKYHQAAYQDLLKFGMSGDCIISTWGKPNKVNMSISQGFTFEQWVYYRNGVFYLYFRNGVLISAQTSHR